jgi:hypothetical protein
VVGGFFSKEARESSYAKVSVGTFPKLPIKKADANRVVVKKFKKALRASQHAAIANCYREYNAKGGRIVPLQTGDQVLLYTCAAYIIIRGICNVTEHRRGTVQPCSCILGILSQGGPACSIR